MSEEPTRLEHDTLGTMEVPAEALYGAQTARAVANFPVSGWTVPVAVIRSLARIKAAFARANAAAGLLDAERAAAIEGAALAVVRGEHAGEFPVDVFQTGSGTSTNMNVNEVLAHVANRTLGGEPAENRPVHPNDHVNKGQSSNDVFPAAVRLAALVSWRDELRPALEAAVGGLRRLASAHGATVTLGRTHLMDAVPTTYGRVFGAWATRLDDAAGVAEDGAARLLALPLGGTAVGTGLGSDPEVVEAVVRALGEDLGLALVALRNPAAGMAAQEPLIGFSDALAGIGRVLLAVANDLRLRSSGPFGGLGELRLPAVQPGSSIMPGKVNPVIPEAVLQAAIEVEGLASACRLTVVTHQLDLSLSNPLLAFNLDTMVRLLAGSCRILTERCLDGLEVDRRRARELALASPAMATALAARIGYERAAEVAKEAERRGERVIDAAARLRVLPDDELAEALAVDRLAGADAPGE